MDFWSHKGKAEKARTVPHDIVHQVINLHAAGGLWVQICFFLPVLGNDNSFILIVSSRDPKHERAVLACAISYTTQNLSCKFMGKKVDLACLRLVQIFLVQYIIFPLGGNS